LLYLNEADCPLEANPFFALFAFKVFTTGCSAKVFSTFFSRIVIYPSISTLLL
jgi:hypothetical protein